MSECTNENVMETVDIMPEMTEVVVYNRDTIENVLKILDQQTPVTGVETMRKIVEVFDIMKHEGSVQQAAVNREGNETEFVNPEFVPEQTPQFMGEGEVMYEGEEELHVGPGSDVCDNEAHETVDVEEDELREVAE